MKPTIHHSLRLDRATTSSRTWRYIIGLGVLLALSMPLRALDVIVTVENLAPPNGTYLTPTWMGFHNGGFDLYNIGSAATSGLESVAEDGAATALTGEFTASGAGSNQAVTSGGPIAPGQRRSVRFALDPTSPSDRYLSFAAMVIPSNDAFIGNENPQTYTVFDAAGNFIGGSWIITGGQVNDAGTEVNDELPANTAFFGQTTANTGTTQGGTVQPHAGFKAKGSGGILDSAMFANADFKAANYQVARITISRPVEVIVTVENLAPTNGNYLTPMWMGFHNGGFDLYNIGSAATPGLESVAEDGAAAALSGEFTASSAGSMQGVTTGGPIAPGQRRSLRFSLDATAPEDRYFSYAAMVIPSNDAFIGNESPQAYSVFDAAGNFVGGSWIVSGSQVNDAGTEVNDELPANTAFFGQTTANTGVTEGGTVQPHAGFKAKGSGGILDSAMFANADFKAANYQVARITISRPVEVIVTVENLAPTNGNYLTPMWMGFHNGGFDLFNMGSAASPGLESVAEDGSAAKLTDQFTANGAGSIQGVTAGGPIAPGQKRSLTFSLDRSSTTDGYFSFASMVIPSNDAFIGNDDPQAYAVFDGVGRFVGGSWVVAGSHVYDAGTEVNDELPANTAFFGQTTADTGVTQGGTVQPHAGFKPRGSGGILDSAMFANADFKTANYQVARITVAQSMPVKPVDVIVTVENLAPASGNYLTPMWLGFHNGGFDLFNMGSMASPGLESFAEDGAAARLTDEFNAFGAGSVQGVTAGGPIAPGQRRSLKFALDPSVPADRYFSFAAMVIPSNDAFIGNDDPQAYVVFDGAGRFVGGSWVIAGSQVYDAGTEVNDELPANTAFFGQTTANTGTMQDGTVQPHAGFKAKGGGGILDSAMFANADFKAANYQVARITISRPVEVTVIVENLSPQNGTYLTPMWLGFQNGDFDLFTDGSAASPGLESVAEDGAAATLTDEFTASGAGSMQGVTSGGPIAPGQRRVVTFSLDPASPFDRYFSYVSMVIPSNDAFIGNGNPLARPVFDATGNFVGGSWIVTGDQAKDAGTEVNDELPANTAFFGQTTANTGTTQGGTVQPHSGFKAKGSGGILDAPMFANADFKAPGYQIARISVVRSAFITEITVNGSLVNLTWLGGSAPYLVQRKTSLSDANWVDVTTTQDRSASVAVGNGTTFFRVASQAP
ncbi:MAG: spondin domain-containing protein [Verrucomicrobiota bacterium]